MLDIKKCRARHGRFNIDNGNIIVEVDVELNSKIIEKNMASKLEKQIESLPELIEGAEKFMEWIKHTAQGRNLKQQSGYPGIIMHKFEDALKEKRE